MTTGYFYLLTFMLWNSACIVWADPGKSACDSPIFCDGDMLHAIQTAELFEDSKTFVDMNLKTDPDTVLAVFQRLKQSGTPTKESLRYFLDQYFEGPGEELEQWTPADYKESPDFLSRIQDKTLRQFGKDMCRIWSHLGRKIRNVVGVHPERYSIIPLQNPFIVPGGRFREIYYWDSYWVVKGLLVCEMYDTVRGILQNFVSFIQRFGLVPNGGRYYYTRRSQPPLLVPMVQLYIQRTNDTGFLEQNLHYLIQEYEFWNNNRTLKVPGQNYELYRFNVDVDQPRPESYLEDMNTNNMKKLITGGTEDMFSDLASAAESGWDFSSRWFSKDYNQTSNTSQWLSYTNTTDVLPVDLNSILCWNEKILSDFHKLIGNTTGVQHFLARHNATKVKIQETLWDDSDGTWYDYSVGRQEHKKNFHPSNLFPLFAGCYHESEKLILDTRILRYMKKTGTLEYASGVPTSMVDTGQQWDFPNAWPPLQDVIITSLEYSDLEESRKLAFRLTSNWMKSNLIGFHQTGAMFEKYIVDGLGSRGAGGEYNVQEGFGWTNGLVLDLLERYGQNLTAETYHIVNSESKGTSIYASYMNGAVVLMNVVVWLYLV